MCVCVGAGLTLNLLLTFTSGHRSDNQWVDEVFEDRHFGRGIMITMWNRPGMSISATKGFHVRRNYVFVFAAQFQ